MSASKGPDWFNEGDIDKMHMLAACAEGNIERVRVFLEKGVQVDEFDDDRVTALQIAAAKGHVKLVRILTFYFLNLYFRSNFYFLLIRIWKDVMLLDSLHYYTLVGKDIWKS